MLLRLSIRLSLLEEVLLVQEELLLLVLLLELLEVGRCSIHARRESEGWARRGEGRLALGRVGSLLRSELRGGTKALLLLLLELLLLLLLRLLVLLLLRLLLLLLVMYSSVPHVRLDFFERERSS